MRKARIAYFTMEVGLSDEMPTFSGGLGVLAGDTLRAAADQGLPLVAVTLLHRTGYFRQRLDETGAQSEEPEAWDVGRQLVEQEPRVEVEIGGESVSLRCWAREIEGVFGARVPLFFLDADVEGNGESARRLTDSLYGGDQRYRLAQEAILGIGGVRMLRALGYDALETFHMNEGHSSLLVVELIEELAARSGREEPGEEDVSRVRDQCVFTTHTPVTAGHDRFSRDLVEAVLGVGFWKRLAKLYPLEELNMTELALKHSRYVNGVARRHGEVTKNMFDGYDVEAITNGVHAATWTSPPFQELFDRHVPGWRFDNQSLRYLVYTPLSEIEQAHRAAKRALLDAVRASTRVEMDEAVLTIGFARRATAYKRADLLFRDVARLERIAAEQGALQIVYGGKAHPRDTKGKEIIRRIVSMRGHLSDKIRLVYLEDYGLKLGGLVSAGCDLWLNNPEPPQEASGTSGMKAALNGVPSLSVLDGWWLEGHIEGVTGWSIGEEPAIELGRAGDGDADAARLYDKLERIVVPLYYRDRKGYLAVMRYAIALNGSFFNTERMVSEYARQAYRLSRSRG